MLTLLATIKTRLGISDTDDDAHLTGLAEIVHLRFDQFCNRNLEHADAATYEVRADATAILLPRYPVSAAITQWDLKSNEPDGWETEAATPDHLLDRDSGVVRLAAPLGTDRQRLRLTYAGGYILPGDTAGAGETDLPDAIQELALQQTLYLHRHREKLGLASVSTDRGSMTYHTNFDLIPEVQEALRPYQRLRL